jgi:hypothetical protein
LRRRENDMWNYAAIKDYTKKIMVGNEIPFLSKINSMLPYSMELRQNNVGGVTMVWNGKSIYNMEVECGHTQKMWTQVIPGEAIWPRGLSLSCRKNYSSMVFFLKYSYTMESGILVMNPSWFIANSLAHYVKHSLPFETSDRFFSISWPAISANLGGAIQYAQYDDWKNITRTLFNAVL